jgi:two-component system, OmpR family, response regulator
VRVLVVEDDENVRVSITGSLRGAGFAVDAVADLRDADEALAVNSYDCAVFDRMLPSGDALHYVRARRPRVPILFLTALDAIAERIAGLEYGDDYLAKPFAMAELEARVRSLCRLSTTGRPPVLNYGSLQIDSARHEVRRFGVLLTLTAKEFDVLEYLVAKQGALVSREELIAQCWDPNLKPASNIVDVVLRTLRRKLGDPPMIPTIRGIGYRADAI